MEFETKYVTSLRHNLFLGWLYERLTDYLQHLLLLITFYVRTSLERQSLGLVTSSWSSCSKSCDGGQTSLY